MIKFVFYLPHNSTDHFVYGYDLRAEWTENSNIIVT